MSQENLSPITINNQYIKDLSLEIPFAPAIFSELKTNPKTDIDINVNVNKLGDNNFAVELSTSINSNLEDKKFFVLEMTYGASVTLNVPEEHIEPVLLVEIPRLLFPFLRNTIATTMANGGLPTFLLNPIDFLALYNAKKQNGEAVN